MRQGGKLGDAAAQLKSHYGSEGWGFESLRAHKKYQVRVLLVTTLVVKAWGLTTKLTTKPLSRRCRPDPPETHRERRPAANRPLIRRRTHDLRASRSGSRHLGPCRHYAKSFSAKDLVRARIRFGNGGAATTPSAGGHLLRPVSRSGCLERLPDPQGKRRGGCPSHLLEYRVGCLGVCILDRCISGPRLRNCPAGCS